MSTLISVGVRAGRIVAFALWAFASWGGMRSAQAAEPPPVADFFRRPLITEPVVSPSGKYAAATMLNAKGRHRLMILNLADIAKSTALAEFDDADIVEVHWVNDDRLVFQVSDLDRAVGDRPGWGLMSIDREGRTPLRTLIQARYGFFFTSAKIGQDRVLPAFEYEFHSVLRDGSNDVIVKHYRVDGTQDVTQVGLLRLDTATGRSQGITPGAPDHAMFWAVDPRGVPRATVSVHEGKSRLYWKRSADAEWSMVREFDTFQGKGAALQLLQVSADGFLYALAPTQSGKDTVALVRFDISKGLNAPETVMEIDGYDFTGRLILGKNGLLRGVRYLSDARGTHWFDPAMKKTQADVDALMPGLINILSCGPCEPGGQVMVASYSDHQPPAYSIFDGTSRSVGLLAQSMPWIDAKAMATNDIERFDARDGLSIPVHVTRPRGAGAPAPAVVLVHGGPFIRGGEWRWDRIPQFLASRGYAVIEPEFRGSTGFGARLFTAGWKQWGLAMQDDIADATTWAIKKGYADPKRVCIAGASYGGYATLMGLIRYPELYRCGFEWVGVTDIDLMYSIQWSDISEVWKQYGMPVLVGDREADARQFAETSPLKRAAELKQPLLMAYGGSDRRVPIEHGLKMRDALTKTNRNVEWASYPAEGHGWSLLETNLDFWGRVERFLDKNLKAAP